MKNPRIQEIAQLIGRTADSVVMRMRNFREIDSPGTGLANYAPADREIWKAYQGDEGRLREDAERLIENFRNCDCDPRSKGVV